MSLLDRRSIYQGKTIGLSVDEVLLPNGNKTQIELVTHRGAAAVVPVFDNKDVVLIRQYRYAAGGYLLELPAGRREPEETLEECARRELREETGYTAGTFTPLLNLLTTPGFSDERIQIYMATGLEAGPSALEPNECLETLIMPLSEALKKIQAGEITDGKTIVGLFTAAVRQGVIQLL